MTDLRWHRARGEGLVHANGALLANRTRSMTGLAATRRGIVYGGYSLFAVAALVGGLETLAVDPIAGVLLTLVGMALSLYGVAGLCGAYLSRRK